MANLKNFTLDGNALQLIARKDHHGKELYDVEIGATYNHSMTREELIAFGLNILEDALYGGILNVDNGKLSHPLLRAFIGEE